MNYTREIKSFIFSQYFSDGLRITLGILLPSVILAQYGQLELGIILSLGAMAASIADNPGPLLHKRNGMLVCILCTLITAVLTGFINRNPTLLIIEIPVFCFLFSMFMVYGNRASSIGTAALLIMILTIDRELSNRENLINGLLLLTGGIWYFILSMLVSQIRPYRMAQQTLGGCIREVSKYLEIKAGFYDTDKDYNENYKELIAQQVVVNEEQDVVRELLFKSRLMIKESTPTGRRLVLIFVDVLDLFEQTMATHYDYQSIRKSFGHTKALQHFRDVILKLSEELENLSYYITSNEEPRPMHNFQPELEQLKITVDRVESEFGINNLVLKKILINIRNIVTRLQKIYNYSRQNISREEARKEKDVEAFISHQDYDPKLFLNNLNFKSDIFRHSLRVAIVCLTGYLVSISLPLISPIPLPLGHHSYWILLTILVISKPGFSHTQQRNYQRLIGTIAGGVIGALIVLYVRDETVRFIFLLLFMIAAYSFLRLNYAISVLFMTPYILIMFSFIGLGTLSIAKERIFDTFLGSAIAFLGSYLVLPSWEHMQLKGFIRNALIANYFYLKKAAEKLAGSPFDIEDYKLARKQVNMNSADLAGAFQRMLSEPKSKQKYPREIHNLVVLNHTLSSYIATLISNIHQNETTLINPSHIKSIKKTLYQLCEAINQLNETPGDIFKDEVGFSEGPIRIIEESYDSQLITEQLDFLNNAAGDIQKIAQKIRDL